MREDLTLIFCLLAGFALVFGKGAQPPDLMHAYSAYERALERGDTRRAARYGEIALAAAEVSPLLDRAGVARLQLRVGETQADIGNPQRAQELFRMAVEGFDDGTHADELSVAQEKLSDVEHLTADRSLRGTVGSGS